MTDFLVERLRALVILDGVGSNNPLGREAADEIERLEAVKQQAIRNHMDAVAEIERLRAALTRLTTDITSSAAAMDAVSLSIFEDALAALEKP